MRKPRQWDNGGSTNEILKLLGAGIKQAEIARQLKVSRQWVSHVKQNYALEGAK